MDTELTMNDELLRRVEFYKRLLTSAAYFYGVNGELVLPDTYIILNLEEAEITQPSNQLVTIVRVKK